MGKGGCGQLISHVLCRIFLLTLFTCSRAGSLPWETVLHELLQHGSSHGLPFFTNCSSVGPFHGVWSFSNRPLRCGCPTGSQVLLSDTGEAAGNCSRKPFLWLPSYPNLAMQTQHRHAEEEGGKS